VGRVWKSRILGKNFKTENSTIPVHVLHPRPRPRPRLIPIQIVTSDSDPRSPPAIPANIPIRIHIRITGNKKGPEAFAPDPLTPLPPP
jgi:hypothetical protein